MPEPGFVNVDRVGLDGIDVVHDLDVGPWPWEDASVEEVRAWDVFEHLDDPLLFMAECWRVLHIGALLVVHTAYYRNPDSFRDPTHKRFCTAKTFNYWIPGTEEYRRYGAAYGNFGSVRFALESCSLDRPDGDLLVRLRKLGD
jgi:hypothetical protein